MSLELLYTSAPQGLKQGSRGFCTVISTVGMPINIAQKLESLSGYRHLYPPNDPKSNRNPVAYSHFRFQVGGRTVSLLSRIADYGLDYSQRTNKIAHHIVAETTPACGPAALMASPGVMRTAWDGQCETVATGPNLPQLGSSPEVCESWKRITGDAGWGGVVANAWMQPSNKPTWIVFSEEQSSQMLELMAESIAILPPSKRWQATFSTYVTTLPPDIDCRVRCVVAGSDEARMAAARGTVIDLTKPLGQPPDGAHVEAARNGTLIGLLGASSKSPPGIPSTPTLMDDILDEPELRENVNTESSKDFELDNPSVNIDRIPPDLSARPHQTCGGQDRWEKKPNSQSRKSKKSLYAIAGVIGIFVGLLGAGGTYLYLQTQQLSELIQDELVTPVVIEQKPDPINEAPSHTLQPTPQPENEAIASTPTPEPTLEPESTSHPPPPIPTEPTASTPKERIAPLKAEMLLVEVVVSLESTVLNSHIPGAIITASNKCMSQDPEIVNIFDNVIQRKWIWQKSIDGTTWITTKESEQDSYNITENDSNASIRCIMQIKDGPEKTLESPVQPAKPAILRIPISEIDRMHSLTIERTGLTCSLSIPFTPSKDHEFIYKETKDYTTKHDKSAGELFISGCTLGQLLSDSTLNNLNQDTETLLLQRKEFAESKYNLLKDLNSNLNIRDNHVFTKLKKELKESDDCHEFVENLSIKEWVNLADLMVDFHKNKNTFTGATLDKKLSEIRLLLQKLNIECDNLSRESEQVANVWKQAKNPEINPLGSPIELIHSKANTFITTEKNLLGKSFKGVSRGKICIFKSIKKRFAGDSKKAIMSEYHFPIEVHFFDKEKRGDEDSSGKQNKPSAVPIQPMEKRSLGTPNTKK